MFDKVKFSQILQEIKKEYSSQEEFAKEANFDRTYISKYINMKFDNPPTPKILEKIANASKGITNYTELMLICDYLNDDIGEIMGDSCLVYTCPYTINKKYSQSEKFIFDTIYSFEHLRNLRYTEAEKKQIEAMYNYIKNDDTYQKLISEYKKLKQNYNFENTYIEKLNNLSNASDNLLLIPVIGKIAAGQPILAEEYIEGYLPVDPNVYGLKTSEDLFYLRVSGQSMNLKIKNGDYALIRKQDTAEDGDIVVAIVNSDNEATLKRYRKLNDYTVRLEPMSTDTSIEEIEVDLRSTNLKIIGKAIGQFGKF